MYIYTYIFVCVCVYVCVSVDSYVCYMYACMFVNEYLVLSILEKQLVRQISV